jgi:ABC-2 type transport system ATP-binding protein
MITINQDKVIQVKGLVKKFGNFVANDNLTFDVYKGEIFGFLGANGAGKTTAIKILCGLSKPTAGELTVAGYNVYTQRDKIKSNIGYMSQRFSLYEELTISENIKFYGGIYGIPRKELNAKLDSLVQKLDLEPFKSRRVSSLPLGWKQKLAFSVAILHTPSIVFLDEPTSGVDPITRRQFWDLIYEAVKEGITVFITTHYMDEAEYCNRVSIMVDGKIEALDTPAALKSMYEAENMNDVFVKLARN